MKGELLGSLFGIYTDFTMVHVIFFFFVDLGCNLCIKRYTGVQGLDTEKMKENIGNNKNSSV